MDKWRLPYNILLIITVIALGLMIFFNLALRRSGFAVSVGYAVPAPPPSPSTSESSPAPSPKPAEPKQQTPAQSQRQDEPEDLPQDDGVIYSVQFPLELNQATREQLMFIPRVGDVTSQRIVQYREHLGGYTSLEQLMEISGIGQGTYEQISPYLYLENEAQTQSDHTDEDGLTDEHYDEHDHTGD